MRFEAEPNRALRQFERDSALACAAMAFVALAARRGQPDAAVGVLAGGVLTGLSYWALKGAVDLVSRRAGRERSEGDREPPLPAGKRVVLVAKFLSRYALLAVGAYVMLTCLRVHPVGMLAGATSPFLAAVGQLVRAAVASSRVKHR